MSGTSPVSLQLLPLDEYVGVNRADPIRFYHWPVIGPVYKRRVEMCLAECTGGDRVLEIGFGSGVSFPNLAAVYRQVHGLDLTADVDAVARMFAARGIPTHLRNGSVLDMPYPDAHFDTVLLVSILEHLRPADQPKAFAEIARVLKPGGQVVYGVPVERKLMVFAFRLLGYDIRQHHFSTEADVAAGPTTVGGLSAVRRVPMYAGLKALGPVYEVGTATKA